TTGYGSTIAAAVADYERKMGKLAAGGLLTSRQLGAIEWYRRIDASQGPTSIRRSRSGGYYGEYYRPSRGAIHNGPYATMSQAVDWLKAQGL
ncbi:MAG: hypothetical protein OEM62_11660, partial [Acidobacteriota bacterium]|nr:hypothetical protein [Acidobacteriota bacterium]